LKKNFEWTLKIEEIIKFKLEPPIIHIAAGILKKPQKAWKAKYMDFIIFFNLRVHSKFSSIHKKRFYYARLLEISHFFLFLLNHKYNSSWTGCLLCKNPANYLFFSPFFISCPIFLLKTYPILKELLLSLNKPISGHKP